MSLKGQRIVMQMLNAKYFLSLAMFFSLLISKLESQGCRNLSCLLSDIVPRWQYSYSEYAIVLKLKSWLLILIAISKAKVECDLLLQWDECVCLELCCGCSLTGGSSVLSQQAHGLQSDCYDSVTTLTNPGHTVSHTHTPRPLIHSQTESAKPFP